MTPSRTPAGVPRAPGATITAGHLRVSVTTTPPTDDGGGTVTGYQARCRRGDTERTSTAARTSLVVTDLTNDVAWSCSARAKNPIGWSNWSVARSVTPRNVPIAVAASIATHTCVLYTAGTIRCWGKNLSGQVGTGATSSMELAPTTVTGIDDATAISTGAGFTCAVHTDRTVSCWGADFDGQLGNGPGVAAQLIPQKVPGLTNVAALATGYSHVCARHVDGTVSCWGDNLWGTIGDGNAGAGADQHVPVKVAGLTKVVSIAAGGGHTCAVRSDGATFCWGLNSTGQLGDSTTTMRTTPSAVVNLNDATLVATGYDWTCARHRDGTLSCWGNDVGGRLGDGVAGGSRLVPGDVVGISTATSISAGETSTCATLAAGTVSCWGQSTSGQAGNSLSGSFPTPVAVTGLSDVSSMSAGIRHVCAVESDGSVFCWGGNDWGQLGNNDAGGESRPTPGVVIGLL